MAVVVGCDRLVEGSGFYLLKQEHCPRDHFGRRKALEASPPESEQVGADLNEEELDAIALMYLQGQYLY